MGGPTILIRLNPRNNPRYVAPPAAFTQNRERLEEVATSTIVVNFNGPGWTSEAQNAFRFAADIWETLITSPIPIVVDADFSPLGPGILGGAGPTEIWRDFNNAPQANTWYPVATANKLANVDLNPASADIGATFNRTFMDWYFGTDSTTPAGEINFVSVVLHELGHGLGFFGSMTVDNGSGSAECQGTAGEGCYGYDGLPVIYDRLTENGSGTPLLDFANNSIALGNQLTSNAVYFDSPGAISANGGNRVPLYVPAIWNEGSSYSHLAESFNGTAHALMTYSISSGETIHNPGSVTLCMFLDMGWTVSDACGADPITGLSATSSSPTELGATTYLTATVSSGSDVSYEWAFGDGNGDTGAEVSHQYTAIGNYMAVVTATNPTGQAIASTTVSVVDVPISGLTAETDSPTLFGSSTQFTATIGAGSNVTYQWDFGDGAGDTGAQVSHQYAALGDYTSVVTATNSAGQATASTMVEVVDAPIVGLSAESDSPTALGSTTHFTATVSEGSNVSYEWDFGDGNGDTGAVVSHQYSAVGNYTAVVTATNSTGQSTSSAEVQILDVPIGGLSVENDSPTLLGSTTHFTATIGEGSNVVYEWDFGDGSGDNGAVVSRQYAAVGSYTAVVTATNSAGQATASTLVEVVDTAIIDLAAENDSPTPLGSATQFTATIGGGSNVSYEWDFGDGSGETGASVSHQYATVGMYTAVVTATNSAGQAVTSTQVEVVDLPINGLAAESDSPTPIGSFTQFTATISGGSNVIYQWDFGDGSADTGAEASHQYAAVGNYTAVVTATNSAGQASTSVQVEVVDIPISGLTVENNSPTLLGVATQFTATVSGGSSISYEWDFGDGEVGYGAETSHQYAAAGLYTATVTATNSVSLASVTTVVQVNTVDFLIHLPVMLKP